ncbi:MAG: hypothetical protein KBS65_06195, partial [Prevotella sp.]|nr:hypothetical protein [Candidatus Equicola stercoris]
VYKYMPLCKLTSNSHILLSMPSMMAQDFYAEGRDAPEGATQRKSNFCKAFARRGGIKKILVVDMVNAIVSHIKTLRETKKNCETKRTA